MSNTYLTFHYDDLPLSAGACPTTGAAKPHA